MHQCFKATMADSRLSCVFATNRIKRLHPVVSFFLRHRHDASTPPYGGDDRACLTEKEKEPYFATGSTNNASSSFFGAATGAAAGPVELELEPEGGRSSWLPALSDSNPTAVEVETSGLLVGCAGAVVSECSAVGNGEDAPSHTFSISTSPSPSPISTSLWTSQLPLVSATSLRREFD